MVMFIGIYPRELQFVAPVTFLIFGVLFYILISKIIKGIMDF